MAPEIFENNGKGYSFEVDIWSVGIIMYQLLTGKLIFNGENKDEFQKKILSFQPENLDATELSEVAADLIKQILVKDPKQRPGINQIIYHYFFHDIEFPKYITPEMLKIYTEEKVEIKEKEEIKQKLKMELYTLIVDDIPEIEYENIKNYIIKESANLYENYVTYYHLSSHYDLCFFEFNNEIVGIIDKNFQRHKEKKSIDINMIYNTETKYFYFIKIGDNIEDDILERYTEEEIPENLKRPKEILLNYYNLNLKKRKNIEVKDENVLIKEENSFPSTNKSEGNSLSNENSIISQNRFTDKKNLIYVRKILVKKKVTIFFLSDQTIEAYFIDKIKILISEIIQKIEIINLNNEINVVSETNAFQNPNNDFTFRLRMIKTIIFKDISDMASKNSKENNQTQINDKPSFLFDKILNKEN